MELVECGKLEEDEALKKALTILKGTEVKKLPFSRKVYGMLLDMIAQLRVENCAAETYWNFAQIILENTSEPALGTMAIYYDLTSPEKEKEKKLLHELMDDLTGEN